jgi:16S rRNA (uracil1498-N3)-methyltransferase
MISALTQCRGGWLPEIHPSARLERAIAATPEGTRLLLDPDAPGALIGVKLDGPVSIALGPEGGVEERERDEMIAGGFQPVSLAGGLLRFETAGVAALAIARALLAQAETKT